MKKENLERGLTQLIQDVKLRLNELGTEGVIDPFKSIISIVFRKFSFFFCFFFRVL